MKKTLLRISLFVLSLLLLLQTGAFPAFGLTGEEVQQYEDELAVYLEWREYREQETAYYAYQTALSTYAAENEVYLQYQSAVDQIEKKLKCLDYIFIQDNRGWALIESINLGVGAVTQFAEDPANLEQHAALIGELKDVLLKAKNSSEALKSIFEGYRQIVGASYSSEYERVKARFVFYQNNYSSLLANSDELCKDLFSFYDDALMVVKQAIINKEKEKDMVGRYMKLVYQLFVLSYCLDDKANLPKPTYAFILEGRSLNEVFGVGSPQIMQDTNQANPSGTSFPASEVQAPQLPPAVEKPTKPTSTEITVEPTPPEGYVPGTHYHSWNAGVVTREPTCTASGVKTYTCLTCAETKTETIAPLGHQYTAKTTQATCTEEGYTTHTCSRCGDFYTDSKTSALGHVWNDGVVTKAATCTEVGIKTYTCTRCSTTKKETIAALGHDYGIVVTPPTCTAQGYTTHTCSRCKASYVDSYTDPTGHTWNAGVVTKAAICTESGILTKTCTKCGAKTTETIPALGHAYKDTVTAPTCLSSGYTTHTCTRSGCGHTYTDSITPALGHAWNNGVVTKAATCTETGVKTYTCTRCQATRTETLLALGHAYKDTVVKPTCEADGYTVHTCTRAGCGHTYTDSITPALGHAWNSGVITTPATDEEPGVKTFTCTRCGATRTEGIPSPGHAFVALVTPPTCTEEGYTTHTCSHAGCGKSYVDTYVAALGHDYEIVVTPATCTQAGVKTYTCKRCHEVKTEEIPAIGHDYKPVVTSPSCTEQGYTTYTCSHCKDSYKTAYTDALGHAWNAGVVTTAPTCTLSGVKTYTCSRCKETKTEEIPATGHDYGVVTTTPTCTEKGYSTHTCKNCGDSYTDGYTEALGHTWDAGVVTTEPGCTTAGEKTYTCSRCKEIKIEGIPAHGHDYEAVITPPTCTEAGYTTHTCSYCKDHYVDTETDALGHDWNAGVVTTLPTEILPGVRTYTCSRCGSTRTEEIPALGESMTDENPVKEIGRDSVKQQDLKNSVAGKYTIGMTGEELKAEISVAAAQHMLDTGVQSVKLEVVPETRVDRIFFTVTNGTPNPSARLFRLVLEEGGTEDYRYAYYRRKKATSTLETSGVPLLVSLSTGSLVPTFDGATVSLEGESSEWELLPYGKVSMSLSEEILRVKSYYIRPDEALDDEHCHLSALPVSAAAGETVTINPPCDFGYEVKKLSVVDDEGNAIPTSGMTFIMPERPVTISFTVEKIVYRLKYYFDGELIAEQEYGLGDEIVPPAEDTLPQKESDEEYHYTFIGWSPDLKTASGDERELTMEAQFAKTDAKYEKEFYNLRGAFLKPLLLGAGLLLLLAGGVAFLIVFLKKRKKKQKEETTKE